MIFLYQFFSDLFLLFLEDISNSQACYFVLFHQENKTEESGLAELSKPWLNYFLQFEVPILWI
jgi:hypothetical protein